MAAEARSKVFVADVWSIVISYISLKDRFSKLDAPEWDTWLTDDGPLQDCLAPASGSAIL